MVVPNENPPNEHSFPELQMPRALPPVFLGFYFTISFSKTGFADF